MIFVQRQTDVGRVLVNVFTGEAWLHVDDVDALQEEWGQRVGRAIEGCMYLGAELANPDTDLTPEQAAELAAAYILPDVLASEIEEFLNDLPEAA